MNGQTSQALDCLKVENNLDQEVKLKIDNLTNGLRENQPLASKILN